MPIMYSAAADNIPEQLALDVGDLNPYGHECRMLEAQGPVAVAHGIPSAPGPYYKANIYALTPDISRAAWVWL